MTWGLIAALGWGLSTIAAARAAPRIGTYGAVLASQLLGAAALGVLAAVMRPPLAGLREQTALGLAAAGVLGLAGWLTYYRALEGGGQVGVISAIAATYGAIAAVLAVTVLGERLRLLGGAGIILAAAGIAMAAARSSGTRRAGRLPAAGIALALASALTYGVSSCMLGGLSVTAGWLPAALVSYASSVAALTLALPFRLARRGRPAAAARRAHPAAGTVPWPGLPPVHHDRRAGDSTEPAWPPAQLLRPAAPARVTPALAAWPSGVGWAAAAGLAEAVALAAIAAGGQGRQMVVTAATSSLYPLIPLAAGLWLFRERLARRQVVGVAAIVAGLVMIGLR